MRYLARLATCFLGLTCLGSLSGSEADAAAVGRATKEAETKRYIQAELRRSPALYSLAARLATAKAVGGELLHNEIITMADEIDPNSLSKQAVISHDGPKITVHLSEEILVHPGRPTLVRLQAEPGWYTLAKDPTGRLQKIEQVHFSGTAMTDGSHVHLYLSRMSFGDGTESDTNTLPIAAYVLDPSRGRPPVGRIANGSISLKAKRPLHLVILQGGGVLKRDLGQ